jgi:hypothetical protein
LAMGGSSFSTMAGRWRSSTARIRCSIAIGCRERVMLEMYSCSGSFFLPCMDLKRRRRGTVEIRSPGAHVPSFGGRTTSTRLRGSRLAMPSTDSPPGLARPLLKQKAARLFETGSIQSRSVPAYRTCFVERAATGRRETGSSGCLKMRGHTAIKYHDAEKSPHSQIIPETGRLLQD